MHYIYRDIHLYGSSGVFWDCMTVWTVFHTPHICWDIPLCVSSGVFRDCLTHWTVSHRVHIWRDIHLCESSCVFLNWPCQVVACYTPHTCRNFCHLLALCICHCHYYLPYPCCYGFHRPWHMVSASVSVWEEIYVVAIVLHASFSCTLACLLLHTFFTQAICYQIATFRLWKKIDSLHMSGTLNYLWINTRFCWGLHSSVNNLSTQCKCKHGRKSEAWINFPRNQSEEYVGNRIYNSL